MRPPVIIGGGLAGIAAALTLRAAGQEVHLIERHAEPVDRLCGDFLAGSAVATARAFGLALEPLDAQPIRAFRVIRHDRAYESVLPFQAFSLSRRCFETALRSRCEAMGVTMILGAQAGPPRQDHDDILIETEAGERLTTGTVFLATGRPPRPGPARATWALGWKQYVRLAPAEHAGLEGAVEIGLLAGARVALSRIEGGQASLCVMSRNPDLPLTWPAMRDWLSVASPHLRRRLGGAMAARGPSLWSRDVAFGPPLRPRAGDHDGVYLLGDQAGLTGGLLADGVSVALRGGVRAARAALSGAGAAQYHNGLRAMLWPRRRYDVSFDPSADPLLRRSADAKSVESDSIRAGWTHLIT